MSGRKCKRCPELIKIGARVLCEACYWAWRYPESEFLRTAKKVAADNADTLRAIARAGD